MNSKKAFIKWMKKNHPKLYRDAVMRMADLGAPDSSSWFDKLTDTITSIAPKYLQYQQQKKVMKMQMQRARQGLPPANVADYSPVIKTRVDLAPETRREIIKAGQKTVSDNMKPVLYTGLALAAFYVLKKSKVF